MVQKQIVCYYAASTLKVIDSQNPLKEYTTKPLYATEDLDEVIGFTSATGSFEFNKINVLAPFICSFYLNDLVFLCSYIKKNNDPIIVSTTYNNVAEDGDGDNSNYAKILAKKIIEKNVDILGVFNRVRAEFEKLNIDQRPTEQNYLNGDVYLNKVD